MDRDKIAALATDYYNKALKVKGMGLQNIAGLTVADARAAMTRYHLADAEMREAKRRLEEAKDGA